MLVKYKTRTINKILQQPSPKDLYFDFCKKAQLPIFVQGWFLDAVCKDGFWDFVFVEEAREVVGVLPYFFKKSFGFSYITMPAGAKYMGPFLLPAKDNIKDQHRIYEKLIQQLPRVHNYEQHFFPDTTNWLPFYWEGYKQTTKYTYRLTVDNLVVLYRSFSEKTRYKIRKAGKTLEIVDNLNAEVFHEVHQMSFDRQGIKTPLSLDAFLSFDKVLDKHHARKLFFARDKEANIHAALYVILDKDIAYMHFLGSNPTFTKSEAVLFIYWHAFQYINGQGIDTIDFEGSMMKNVETILRRVRAVQTPYFSVNQQYSRWFGVVQRMKFIFEVANFK